MILGRIGHDAQSAVPDLQTLAASTDVYEASIAEVALALIQRNDPIVQSNALVTFASTIQPRRFQFVSAAHQLWPTQPELLDKALRDRDATLRAAAAHSLQFYGRTASNSVPALLQMLSDPSNVVRPRAALALGIVAPEHSELAVAVMLDQQRTNAPWTGDYSHVLFQHVGPAAKTAVPSLQAQLTDPRLIMFHGDAAAALWRITGEITPQIIEGLSTGVEKGVQRAQIRSLRILKEIGPPAAAAAPALKKFTNHPRLLIRRLAREALESVSAPPAKTTEGNH